MKISSKFSFSLLVSYNLQKISFKYPGQVKTAAQDTSWLGFCKPLGDLASYDCTCTLTDVCTIIAWETIYYYY